jgi:protein-disulfide isomerase/uncharacterized membrane protein
MKKANFWFLILLVSTLAAIATHGYLTVQHFDLKLGLASGPSICNVSETFNCDTVATSNYAEIFGIPIALLGLFFQLGILVFAFAARFELSSQTHFLRRLVLALSLIAALISIAMGFISSFKLGAYCLFCMLTYLLSFLSLWAAVQIARPHGALFNLGEDLTDLFTKAKWALVILLLVPGGAFVTQSIMLSNYGFGKLKEQIQYSMAEWSSSPDQNFNPEEGLILYSGTGEPKMTIVEFADFLCPHCKLAATTLENFVRARKDVKFIFKTFPLDGKCNKAISRQGDGLRCQLAGSVICAENLFQKGWQAHHWIFANQEKLSSLASWKVIEDLATELGEDKAKLNACIAEDAIYEKLRFRASEGEKAKIEGTPTIFVNGKLLQHGQFPPFLKAVYDSL